MSRAYWEPPSVRRPKPARGNRDILPVDVQVVGDPASGLVDVLLDPGGDAAIHTVRLTTDLVVSLHDRLARKLAQLQDKP